MNKVYNLLKLLLVAVLFIYFYMPVLNFGFLGFPVLMIILLVLWVFLNKQIGIVTNNQKIEFKTLKNPGKVTFIIIGILIVYMTVVPALTSWAVFRTSEYRNLIGKVEVSENIADHMLPISLDKIRVVDQSLAELLGDKVIGSQSALGSQVYLGTFNIQKVNNGLYWVAPLLHSGFFKWQKNMQGTNGYVMVNACNERDVKLVQEINGQKVYIKYQSEAYFFSNLERYLYFKGYYRSSYTLSYNG